MLNIQFSPAHRHEFFRRQTPGRRGEWDGIRFNVQDPTEPIHAWFVYEGLSAPETVLCPPGNTVLITGEPISVRRYHPAFLAQFARVVTSQQQIHHPGRILRQQGLGWHIGTNRDGTAPFKGYDEFKAIGPPIKTAGLALICSTRTLTSEHVQRVTFARRLANHFGDRVDVFGGGLRPIPDKWNGTAPYRYSIVLENSSHDHYWTEKLADAYLGWSFPFYWGCPNLAEYFPEGSYCHIDRNDLAGSIERIERAMANNLYETSLEQLAVARERVLDRYNLYAEMAELARRLPADTPRRTTILPESTFETRPGLHRRLYRRAVGKARSLSLGVTELLDGFRNGRPR